MKKLVGLVFIIICILTLISPIDTLPDFIPLIGQIDDVAAVLLGIFGYGLIKSEKGSHA